MFELKLLKYFKIHLFIKITKIMNVKKYENQNYVIEKILTKNQINEKNHYLVK